MYRVNIYNIMGYKNIKKRLDKGIIFLKGKWQDEEYSKYVELYEAMAVGLYKYEIMTDIFENAFDLWKKDFDSSLTIDTKRV